MPSKYLVTKTSWIMHETGGNKCWKVGQIRAYILFYLLVGSISKKQLNSHWYCENVILELSHSSLSMTQWLSSTHSFLSPPILCSLRLLQRGRRNKSCRHKKILISPLDQTQFDNYWEKKFFVEGQWRFLIRQWFLKSETVLVFRETSGSVAELFSGWELNFQWTFPGSKKREETSLKEGHFHLQALEYSFFRVDPMPWGHTVQIWFERRRWCFFPRE